MQQTGLAMAPSSRSRTTAASTGSGIRALWELVATFGHQSIVTSLMFDPSGRKLRVMTNTGSLHHLDLNSLRHRAAVEPEWLVAVRGADMDAAALEELKAAAAASPLARAWLGSIQSRGADK